MPSKLWDKGGVLIFVFFVRYKNNLLHRWSLFFLAKMSYDIASHALKLSTFKGRNFTLRSTCSMFQWRDFAASQGLRKSVLWDIQVRKRSREVSPLTMYSCRFISAISCLELSLHIAPSERRSPLQGDHSACSKPPVDFRTKVPLWSGLAWPSQA